MTGQSRNQAHNQADNQASPGGPPPRTKTIFSGFFIFVLVILVLAHLYVGWSLVPDLSAGLSVRLLVNLTIPVIKRVGFAVLFFSVVLIASRILVRGYLQDQRLIDLVSWLSSLTMGWFSSLFVFALLRDMLLFFADRGAWAFESAVAVIVASVLVSVIGFFNARRLARVVRVTVPIDQLPEALHDFTIAQITDIHAGATIKAPYIRGIVDRVNALEADVVAITGDVVDGPVHHLWQDTAPLGDIQARHGVCIVTGNHEYYSGADDWIAEFRRLGLRPLLNDHVVLEHKAARLVVAGVNDYSASRVHSWHTSDPVAALEGSPHGVPRILLAHQPRSAPAAAKAGFDLQLSGHTHGGQFWPWNHFVRVQQPFTAGLRRMEKLWVYTSRGTGYWGPPKRLGAPSEITLIRLVPADHN